MPTGAGLAAAGSSIAQGVIGAGAESSAAQAVQSAENSNNALAAQTYGTNTANEQPFITSGQNANSALAGLLGVGGNAAASQAGFNDYLGSTNYNFVKNQGEQGIAYGNAPAYDSSATNKAEANYTTGLAGSALQGYESELGGLSTTGSNQATSLANTGTQYVGQVASNNNNAAGAQSSADIGEASAINSALTGALGGTTASSFAGGGGGGSGFGSVGQAANGGSFTSNSALGSGGFGGGGSQGDEDLAALGG